MKQDFWVLLSISTIKIVVFQKSFSGFRIVQEARFIKFSEPKKENWILGKKTKTSYHVKKTSGSEIFNNISINNFKRKFIKY